MKTKLIEPNEVHQAFHKDSIALLRKYGDKLSSMELLALTSQMVGSILALQDQRVMTPEEALAVIQRNIEEGNANTIQSILGDVKGQG